MNRRQMMLLAFALTLFVHPVISQDNNTFENGTLDLALSGIEFNETASGIVVYAVCQGNVSNATINETEIGLRFQGFYFDDFNKTLTATLNESMKYSINLPKNVRGKADITARISPLGNVSNITIKDGEKSITINMGNENVLEEKKLLKQFVFIANASMIFLILTGMLLVLVRKDKI